MACVNKTIHYKVYLLVLVVLQLHVDTSHVKRAKTSETCSLKNEHRKKMQKKVAMDTSSSLETDFSDKKSDTSSSLETDFSDKKSTRY